MSNETLGWICCVLTCLGSTLASFNIYPYYVIVLLIANITYTIWGLRLKEKPLSFTVVNIYLVIINSAGILHFFGII